MDVSHFSFVKGPSVYHVCAPAASVKWVILVACFWGNFFLNEPNAERPFSIAMTSQFFARTNNPAGNQGIKPGGTFNTRTAKQTTMRSGGNKRRRLLDDSEASSSEVSSLTSAAAAAAAAAPPPAGEGEVVPMMAMAVAGPPPTAVTPPPPASRQQQQQQRQAPLSDPPSIKRSPFPPSSASSSSSEQAAAPAHRPFASAATMGTTLFHVLCCLFALLATSPSSGGSGSVIFASAQELSQSAEPELSTSSSMTYEQYRVDIPAFRFILRPVPESFAEDDARQVLEVAQDVAKSYIVRALERTSHHTNNGHGMADVTVESVELDYEGWFSYSRRHRNLRDGAIIRSASHTRSNRIDQQRHLQGKADYAVIESTLPVGGAVTFASPHPEAVPTQHDVYLLLTYAFFPEGMGGDNNDGGSGGGGGSGLTSALVGRLGYSPSLTGTFFAVVDKEKDKDIVPPGVEEEAKQEQQQEQLEQEQAKVTDSPTSAPTTATKVDDEEDEQVEAESEPEIIVISPLPPNSTSVAPVQPPPNVDNDVVKPQDGEQQDNLLTTQSVEEGNTGAAVFLSIPIPTAPTPQPSPRGSSWAASPSSSWERTTSGLVVGTN